MSPSTRAGRRRFLATAGAALVGLIGTSGCGVAGRWIPGRTPALYRLGLVAPFEGFFAATGYEALEAARSRVQEWNGRFRAAGVQIQVWAVDDGNDVEQARVRARELAADPHLLAVVGHLAPETSAAAAPIYSGSGLLMVSPVPVAAPNSDEGPGVVLSLGSRLSEMASLLWDQVPGVLRCGDPPASGLGLPEAPSGSDGVVSECALQDLAHYLATAPSPPERLVLPLGYCPAALVRAFPSVAFHTVAGRSVPSAAALVIRAVDVTLEAIAASGDGLPSRKAVAEAALAAAEAEGWRRHGAVCHPPVQELALHPCPRPGSE